MKREQQPRSRTEAAARESRGSDDLTLSAASDISRAASLLADAWRPALDESFHRGYRVGHRTGWAAGYRRAGVETTAALTGIHLMMTLPEQAELARRRTEPARPCGQPACSCSACVRVHAVLANVAKFGAPDYPGAGR